MKNFISSLAVAAALIAPAISFAQAGSNDPITRAQVKSEIVQAEQQGVLHQSRVHYPDYNSQDSMHADASAHMNTNANANATAGGAEYGSAMVGSSQSGQPASLPHNVMPNSFYSHR
ncbi:DUF4148 domain-containing protein [Paraburkholderia sp. BL10I2N1]|uniref:DUF4148 domain-containing protein n=1 Tax=Paraburkholderia sp. BL10I2N1 TaxID=1938796 RepID=UPI00105FCF06|nr:DUF4148 domain-containing protein [Paraburkholderia sp. BL10I2N1]TDN61787.1 uncharacterized protein DUF4148 [Paraburkholderia sp. BL10I2N1]